MAQFPANIDLSTLNGTTGFKLSGVAAYDYSGFSAASAGDVNGDGFADLIIGAPGVQSSGLSGTSYVVFGQASGFAANIDLSSLDGTTGFKLSGAAAGDHSGFSVASAGDVNGDGFADLIVGAGSADPNGSASGASYVVFGKASGFAANVDLSTLDGLTGFKLSGETAYDDSGRSVASAGDVNGDGFADLIVGARGADPHGNSASGASYVVFGQASGFAANIDLSSLDGTTGFKLSGAAAGDFSGVSVASAGDVNGDGFADLIVGACCASPHGLASGASYVVFGKASGFAANIDLSSLDGTTGFKLSGETAGDLSGVSVASAGDVNGDGFADLIVGARFADPHGISVRRQLRGVRPGLGLCRQHRSLLARRHHRLQAQRRGGNRPQRQLGRFGGRRQRRRLCRPDRRRLSAPARTAPIPARAMWCSARPRALPPISISPRSTAPPASSSAAWRPTTTAASRSPRPATSTATASPT